MAIVPWELSGYVIAAVSLQGSRGRSSQVDNHSQHTPRHRSKKKDYYRQTSNISRTCRRCSNYTFILDLTPGFNGLCKDNYKTRRETFKFWDLVRLILEVWWYILSKLVFTYKCIHNKVPCISTRPCGQGVRFIARKPSELSLYPGIFSTNRTCVGFVWFLL